MAKKKTPSSRSRPSSGGKATTTKKQAASTRVSKKKTGSKSKAAPKKTSKRSSGKASGKSSGGVKVSDVSGKHLVIVESPTKAKTINKYLGPGYFVMASVGHVRDLPSRNPKGVKAPVPGVDLEADFEPTYQPLPAKEKTIRELQKATRHAADVWFATDLDREGEAIAWHLCESLGVAPSHANRVVFNAITRDAIAAAFEHPRHIEMNRVDAQQARRILDRIVGYQVSPLLWKKVAGGLSAGRVQSVATRIVVEREREIEKFTPEEYWKVTGLFAADPSKAQSLGEAWRAFAVPEEDEDVSAAPTVKDQNAWLSDHEVLKAELVEVGGKKFQTDDRATALKTAQALGFELDKAHEREDEKAKGPAQHLCIYLGHVGDAPDYRIKAIQTKRTKSRPSPPFITSTMQQAAANRMGFALQRTMRIAQQLYEGVDLKGARGATGLITYMRTDSTYLSPGAISAARDHVRDTCGEKYLPDKPNYYKSSNKSAQEAHEAIRPTDVSLTPQSLRSNLSDEQFKLYSLIWRRFVASQMTPAQWDSTSVEIEADTGAKGSRGQGAQGVGVALFRATGRTLVFDGHYKVMGVPKSDDVVLPPLEESQRLGPIHLDPTQHFTSPPPRYTEASLQKKLEEEGIGRPSTYAPIIQTIQDRKYVEPLTPRDKRLMASDLGKVVTDMLTEAFPTIMGVDYTREMESELDEIEQDEKAWREMLREFYDPFKAKLDEAHQTLQHAKAVTEPAPYKCEKCGAPTMYRFGKNGRFLSCSRYPDCDYAAPIDREGKPMQPELTDVLCPIDDTPMIKRTGRFGPFLGATNYPEVKFILKLDPKTGAVVLPKAKPMLTDLDCPKCEEAKLYMRDSKRGFWLSCSRFPKCRGRLAWSKLEEDKQAQLEKQWAGHMKEHPIPAIRTTSGHVITEDEQYLPAVTESEPRDANSGEPQATSSYGADAA